MPIFRPWRRGVERARRAMTRDSGVRMDLDTYNRPMHCHHEKTAVIDGRVAYVGGIDLTPFAGDRLDGGTAAKLRSGRLTAQRDARPAKNAYCGGR